MKLFKSLYLGLAVAALGGMFTACQDEMDTPALDVPVATLKANTTIAELKETMWQSDENYAILCPEKENGEHYIIRGRVISSDASGNIYKSIYIQDETAALTFSVNQNSLYNVYRLGQEVVVDLTGLYIGKYAGLEQVGGYGEYNGTPQVSFMMYPRFQQHVQLNGLPETECEYVAYGSEPTNDGFYCTVMTIADINNATSADQIRNLQSRLVELRNVHFELGGQADYAGYQLTENRNLLDENGNTVVVRSSGYSNFYAQTLPEGTGTVRGMLGYYNGTWQLILRSAGDVLFGDKGQQADPYTVDEALALMDTGAAGWVKGYIVGAVKGGVTAVASDSDIIWGPNVDMDNNVVIAPTADTQDWTKCLVVELPSGSKLRSVANLLDNPSAYQKQLNVRGTFAVLLGMGGVTGNKGTTAEFELEGMPTDPVTPPATNAPGSISANFEGSTSLPTGWKNVTVAGGLSGWYIKNYSSNNYATVSAYLGTADGGPYEMWLVSPAVDLSKSASKTISFISQAAYPASDCTVELYVMTTDNPATSTSVKVNATFAEPPASNYSSWVNSGEIDLSAFSGVVYIGWKYYSAKGGNGNSMTICIDDVNIGGASGETPVDPTPDPTGKGSEDDPYSVAEVVAGTATGEGVWVEGWYVGYVAGQAYDSGATFSGTDLADGFTGSNLILGPTADANDASKCIPVKLTNSACRDALSLTKNTPYFGKHIKLKGDIGTYFRKNALINLTDYKVID